MESKVYIDNRGNETAKIICQIENLLEVYGNESEGLLHLRKFKEMLDETRSMWRIAVFPNDPVNLMYMYFAQEKLEGKKYCGAAHDFGNVIHRMKIHSKDEEGNPILDSSILNNVYSILERGMPCDV